MKLLRNPIFTTGLVIVAVAVVFYQLVMPRMRFGRPSAMAGSALLPASALSALSAPVRPAAKKVVAETPGAGIDREYAELHFDGWIEWPQRDPFLLLTPDPEELSANTETNSPVPTWKLRAILAQTGSRMAVINRGWYHEGDEIDGYRIDRIETGGVWFLGPREKERLGFDTRPRPAGTNSTPAPTSPPALIKP